MKVSIIIPLYNSSRFLNHSINSVLNQTFTDFECLIIDDCSTDDSFTLAKKIVNDDRRFQFYKTAKNMGAAAARNIGIKFAKGKYIAFLDSDDYWTEDKLHKQIQFMENNNINFTFTNYRINDENSGMNDFETIKEIVTYSDIIRFNYIPCSTVMFNQNALEKEFMPNIRGRQDWGLWIKLIKKNGLAIRLNEFLMVYCIRNDSISSNKMRVIKYHWYIYAKFLGFNIFKSVFYFTQNILLHILNSRR